MMPLDTELAAFDGMREHLLSVYEGKFILIKGAEFNGAYDSAEAAYNAGVKAYGQEPFLVKQVTREEQVFTNHALSNGLINAHL